MKKILVFVLAFALLVTQFMIKVNAYTTKYDPKGNVEAVTATVGSITIGGWAYDPDEASQSISVKAYIGTTCLGTVNTNIARSDVNSKFSISGNHGFSGKLSTTLQGTQTVTIKAINLESGVEYTIGSKSVNIPSYTTNYNPKGNVEAVTATDGSITIRGWAYDPDEANQSISVKAYIGTTCLGTLNANQTRSDVNDAFSITGKHGFNGKLNTTLQGTQTVTIKAVDLGSGTEYTIGYKSVTIPSSYTTNYNPKGNVEAVTATDGSITIRGWAYDPDNASSLISVKAYIGTTCLGTLNANQTRSDVNDAFSITGKHGFNGKLNTTLQGTQTVTIKAVDLGSGAEYTIGYKSVTIPSSSTYTTKYDPKGNVEAVTAAKGSITIAGWAYDPDDASQSISVKAYVGSTCLGTVSANLARADVNNAFSISGNHGFSGKLSTTLTGTQTVTIKAVNLQSGVEYTIGSNSITIPSAYTTKYDPKGNVEAVTAADGSITIAGWAYDPDDASQSITMKAYIGSTFLGTVSANLARADVNSAFSISGNHGFGGNLSTTLQGTQTVTIKAVDLGSGAEYTIGSKSVTIPSSYTTKYDPKGNVEAVTATVGSITIAGWAYDPDKASSSINVKAYIGSTCLGNLNANITRADVNSAFSISGKHGFSGKLSTTLMGTQTVIIKAVDLGSGAEYIIGSKAVTIPYSSTQTFSTKYDPIGCIDKVTVGKDGVIYAGGWAYDMDCPSENIEIKMYVGSNLIGTTNTSLARTDVNNAYGLTGTHGFNLYCITKYLGSQTLTIKAVDLGTNKEVTIYSSAITVQNPIIVRGNNKWLYFMCTSDGNTISDYEGTNLYTNAQMASTLQKVLSVQNSITAKGIKTCIYFAPNKSTLYPEYVPDAFTYNSYSKCDQIISYLQNNGVKIINGKTDLKANKGSKELYYKYDTHWNQLGAYVGVKSICDYFNISIPALSQRTITTTNLAGNYHPTAWDDLAYMLGELNTTYNDEKEYFVQGTISTDFNALENSQNSNTITHYNNSSAPVQSTILVVGDSFRESMTPALRSIFRDVYIVHRYKYNSSMISQINPNYLVMVYCERYSSELSSIQ